MKKRFFVVLLALAMALSLVAPAAMAADTIKIGGIGVLSGDYSKYGLAVREGVDLYIKQINAAGGVLGQQVEILWEDTEAKADFAISAYNKLVEQDGVVVVTKPISRAVFYQSLHLVNSVRHRIYALQKENRQLRQRLEDLRVISRAKCLLIAEKHMSEDEAHSYIEKKAMDFRQSKRDIADEIIRSFD